MTITLVPVLVALGLLVGLIATFAGTPGTKWASRLVLLLVTIAVPILGGWLAAGYVLHRRRPVRTAAH